MATRKGGHISLLRDYQFRELTTFGGPWLLPDATMVTTQGALLAVNVEYSAGSVGTRLGYGAAFTGAARAVQMYAWYAPFSATFGSSYSDSALAWFKPEAANSVQVYNLKTGASLFSVGGVGVNGSPASASFVGVGMRLYATFHTSAQRGYGYPSDTQGGMAYCFASGPTNNAYSVNLFGPPLRSAPVITEPLAGVVTAGVHRIGYLLENYSGFTTRVSPDTGATPPGVASFAPVSATAAGSKNLLVSFSATTFQQSMAYVSIVMTTTGNLNQYYIVPGSRTAITYTGSASLLTVAVNISDADLASQGIDATPYLYRLTKQAPASDNSDASLPPFYPSHLCLWGDRMAYKAYQGDNSGNLVDCLYVSDRNDYQAITADQHLIQLPGQRNIVTMFRMGGNNYIVGPHEIYGVTDTGDVPVTWPAPHLVDGRTGTLAIHGVEVAPSGQYAWIADQAGLFLFNGAPITALPVSYYQSSDWARINWGVAYTIQIKDDAGKKRLNLLVPLDGATTPSHIMVFDYTDGADYTSVRYSLDSLTSYSIGAIELVRNDLSGQVAGNRQGVEVWLGPSSGTSFLRRKTALDTNPYRDVAAAITSTYRTCPLPGRDKAGGVISMHHGFHARLKGAGVISPILYDIDAQRGYAGRQVTLATLPDADTLFLVELRNELAFIEFSTSVADTHWHLAYLKYYYSPYIMQR